jgi:coenzyme F420-reducing hydrogenase delta subunit
VACAGNLHTSVVELAIRAGTPGVLILSCPPRDCSGREGPRWLDERLYHDREAELQARVDRRRVRVAYVGFGERTGALAALAAFQADLALLEPPHVESHPDVAAPCVPVALETEEAVP